MLSGIQLSMPEPGLARQVSKKLLNEPTDAVSEMIDGIIETNCCLNRIAGYNVVVRHDADAKRNDQVAVISGARHATPTRTRIAPRFFDACARRRCTCCT